MRGNSVLATPISRLAAVVGVRTLTLTFTLCFSALFLASCGGGSNANLLPARDADQLTTWLDQVGSFANQGSCDSAGQTTVSILQRIDALPPSVDARLRQQLTAAAENLQSLVHDPAGCTPSSKTAPITPTTPTQANTTTQTTPSHTTTSVGGGTAAPGATTTPGGGTGTTTATTPPGGGGATP